MKKSIITCSQPITEENIQVYKDKVIPQFNEKTFSIINSLKDKEQQKYAITYLQNVHTNFDIVKFGYTVSCKGHFYENLNIYNICLKHRSGLKSVLNSKAYILGKSYIIKNKFTFKWNTNIELLQILQENEYFKTNKILNNLVIDQLDEISQHKINVYFGKFIDGINLLLSKKNTISKKIKNIIHHNNWYLDYIRNKVGSNNYTLYMFIDPSINETSNIDHNCFDHFEN